MKITPVILCGGEGTRLWTDKKNLQPKQFIKFGNWSLLDETFSRIKDPLFDYPIISTNYKYHNNIKNYLKKYKFKRYIILLEPEKKNTAAAILSSTFAHLRTSTNSIKDHKKLNNPLLILSSDHYIESKDIFLKQVKNNIKYLNNENIFIFGARPTNPSSEYGYFLTNKKNKVFKVKKFFEKPKTLFAEKIIKKGAYWNTGMFLINPKSIILNFSKYSPKIFDLIKENFSKSSKLKLKKNIYHLNKALFKKLPSISFDYAILEYSKKINAIMLNTDWSDLGSWKEILNIFFRTRKKYFNKKNTFFRPWGKFTNLYKGKNFLIKEIVVKPKKKLSLQKHFFRSEHWLIKKGTAHIILNGQNLKKRIDDTIFIPKGAIHRVENKSHNSLVIYEAQIGKVLKETDIIRFKDDYGRAKK